MLAPFTARSAKHGWLHFAAFAVVVALTTVLIVETAATVGFAVVLSGLVLVGCIVVVRIHSVSVDLFSPAGIFFASYGLLFLLRPGYELLNRSGEKTFLGYRIDDSYSVAILIACVGLVSFTSGYLLGTSSGRPKLGDPFRVTPNPAAAPTDQSIRRAIAVTVACAIAFAIFVAQNGGVGFLVELASGRSLRLTEIFSASSGYLYSAPMAVGGIAVWIFAFARVNRRSAYLAVAVGLMIFSLYLASGQGSRSVLLPSVLSFAMVYYLIAGKRPKSGTLIGLGSLVFVFGISLPRIYRQGGGIESALFDPQGGAFDLSSTFGDFLLGPDTAMVNALAVEVDAVPSRVGFVWGETYIGALARVVPNELWPSKPSGSADVLLNEALFPTTHAQGTGFSFSIFGEPFLNFGWLGVVLVLTVFGVACARFNNWARTGEVTVQKVALYACSVPFIFVFMRGGLGADYARLLIVVLPLLFVMRTGMAMSNNQADDPHVPDLPQFRPKWSRSHPSNGDA